MLSWTCLDSVKGLASLAPQSLEIVSSLHSTLPVPRRYLSAELARCVTRVTEVTYTSALDVSKHHWVHSCELLKQIAPSCSAGIVVFGLGAGSSL